MNFFRNHIISITVTMLLLGMVLLVYLFYISPKSLRPSEVGPSFATAPVQTISGVVMNYGNNPHGDIDKMLIRTQDETTWVHFPPHLGRWILQQTKQGEAISIEYKVSPNGKEELKRITDHDHHFVDLSSMPPPAPSRGDEVTVSGNKFDIKKDEGGRTVGFALADRFVVLPPHVAGNMGPMIGAARKMTVTGQQRSEQDGFVNVYGKVLRPSSITIDGMTYLIQ